MIEYNNPLLLFSSLCVIVVGLLSFIIFLTSSRDKHKLHRISLYQWSLGFFLFLWSKIPIILVGLGVTLIVSDFELFYVLAFVASIIAYLLFYRGTIMLFTVNKLWLNIVPLVFFIFFVAFILTRHFIFQYPFLDTVRYIFVFYYTINLFLIAAGIKLLRGKLSFELSKLSKIGVLSFIIGWTVFLLTNLYFWQSFTHYPEELWFVTFIFHPYAYLGYTMAYLLILVGFILSFFHFKTPSVKPKKPSFILGISSMIIIAAVSTNLVTNSQMTSLILTSPESRFVSVDQQVPIDVTIEAKRPVNAIEAVISFPSDKLEAVSISQEGSVVNLWIQEPSFSNQTGLIEFSGIITGGFEGNDKVLTIIFKPKEPGKTSIDFSQATLLAHDGQGTDITGSRIGLNLIVREQEAPSPDINNNGLVDIIDISVLIFSLGKDDARYDFNKDNNINLTDLSILISQYMSK